MLSLELDSKFYNRKRRCWAHGSNQNCYFFIFVKEHLIQKNILGPINNSQVQICFLSFTQYLATKIHFVKKRLIVKLLDKLKSPLKALWTATESGLESIHFHYYFFHSIKCVRICKPFSIQQWIHTWKLCIKL